MIYCVIVLFAFCEPQAQAVDLVSRPVLNLLSIKYVEMNYVDRKILSNFKFNQKPMRAKTTFYNISFDLTEPLHTLFTVTTTHQRWSSNVYQPTVIKNLVFDICGILKNNHTLIVGTEIFRLMYPPFLETFKTYAHPCPFLPGYYYAEAPVKVLYLPEYAPAVDGKSIWRFYTSKNRTLLQYTVFFEMKRGFPPATKNKTKLKSR